VASRKPFGGKQVVVVGEFLQLRPVPNMFDEGAFCFESGLFHCTISHRFELKQVKAKGNTHTEGSY
jgi:hypothetical protein